MSDRTLSPLMSEIKLWPADWAPAGWAFCDGSLLSTTAYPGLYSLIGNMYGGNGQEGTFALPDLRGRVPLGVGQPLSGDGFLLAQAAGSNTVTLDDAQIPTASSGGSGGTPGAVTGSSDVTAAQPHSNMQPFLALNFIINLTGYFPQRS